MKIVGVQPEEFPQVYTLTKWAFDSFATRSSGEATAEDLAGQVLSKTSQCWIAVQNEIEAVALTEVRDARLKSVVMTHCAGRDRQNWQEPMVKEIQAWAVSIGASRFGTISRPGWTPFLRKMGLRETHRIMEMSLE